MKTQEYIGLALLLWFAFRHQLTGSADVVLTVNDPNFPEISGQRIDPYYGTVIHDPNFESANWPPG